MCQVSQILLTVRCEGLSNCSPSRYYVYVVQKTRRKSRFTHIDTKTRSSYTHTRRVLWSKCTLQMSQCRYLYECKMGFSAVKKKMHTSWKNRFVAILHCQLCKHSLILFNSTAVVHKTHTHTHIHTIIKKNCCLGLNLWQHIFYKCDSLLMTKLHFSCLFAQSFLFLLMLWFRRTGKP